MYTALFALGRTPGGSRTGLKCFPRHSRLVDPDSSTRAPPSGRSYHLTSALELGLPLSLEFQVLD